MSVHIVNDDSFKFYENGGAFVSKKVSIPEKAFLDESVTIHEGVVIKGDIVIKNNAITSPSEKGLIIGNVYVQGKRVQIEE